MRTMKRETRRMWRRVRNVAFVLWLGFIITCMIMDIITAHADGRRMMHLVPDGHVTCHHGDWRPFAPHAMDRMRCGMPVYRLSS